ncbi:hypothetical protein ACNSOL_11620 (plasmid) [Aliarcobacter lanthieri]|uniref:hypothetical protein n=1 Tax=Aliarcobacter lanthieri TaxID=1355374 RepID=UPI003AAB05C0
MNEDEVDILVENLENLVGKAQILQAFAISLGIPNIQGCNGELACIVGKLKDFYRVLNSEEVRFAIEEQQLKSEEHSLDIYNSL